MKVNFNKRARAHGALAFAARPAHTLGMLRAGSAVSVVMLLGVLGCAEDHRPRRAAAPIVASSDAAAGTPGVAARDAEAEVAAVSGCEYGGKHYIAGERFIDAEQCQSCRCERAGSHRRGQVSCSTAFCDEGTRCDGGPCSSCSIGAQSFPVGTSLSCDGCNECTCIGMGGWLSTLVICDWLPPLQRCAQPPAAGATTSLVYFDAEGWARLALRVEFERGGCASSPELRGCYDVVDAGRVRVWLQADGELASCQSPFIEERTFDAAALREELRGGRDDGSLVLEIGEQTLRFEF